MRKNKKYKFAPSGVLRRRVTKVMKYMGKIAVVRNKFSANGQEGYVVIGFYTEDEEKTRDRLGKHMGRLSQMTETFAQTVSLELQEGEKQNDSVRVDRE